MPDATAPALSAAPSPVQRKPAVRGAAGEAARERLLEVGLRLFAEQGFAKTSIRQIAQAAGTNVASVSYYFGHKAGLYRAVYFCSGMPPASAEPPHALDELFRRLLAPLRSSARARAWVQLQRREMFDPSGLWREQVDLGVRPMHDALVAMLCERLGIEVPDDAVQALATMVIAPAVHLIVNCEVIDLLAPQLLSGEHAIDRWCERLLRHAELLIEDECRTRRPVPCAAGAHLPAHGLHSPQPGAPAPHRPPRSRA